MFLQNNTFSTRESMNLSMMVMCVTLDPVECTSRSVGFCAVFAMVAMFAMFAMFAMLQNLLGKLAR